MNQLIRINKFLSDSGVCSRRKADEHILAGDVSVNGDIISELGVKIDPGKDKVVFRGSNVVPTEKYIYYALNKPKGVISTASDEKDRKTVMSFVPESPRVYPVGRLDRDSEGLILLTNDGQLTNILSHPRGEHEKEYEVVAVRKGNYSIDSKKIERAYLSGIIIEGKLMKADTVNISMTQDAKCRMKIVLHTGYNRQIRRMCDKIGLDVRKLTRVRIGKLNLANLNIPIGGYVEVKREDII